MKNIISSLLFLTLSSSCSFFNEESVRDDYPRLTQNSIIGYDLNLNIDEFQKSYSSDILDCMDDKTAILGEGYYSAKYKYPIKICHLRGNIEVEFTDVQSSKYEIKQFKKDYPTKAYPFQKVIEGCGDSVGRRFAVSEPSDIDTNRDARIFAKQRFHKGVLYLFAKPVWENNRHKDKDTADFGRLIYVNDQLENLIQDKLREQRDRKERN